MKPVQPTLQEVTERSQKYTATTQQQKKLDDALVEMVARDMQPSTIVEDKGFNKLVHLLDPRYQLPSRRSLMRKIPAKYDKVREEVKDELDHASAVCLTTDIWTSRISQSYMTVTCHFIDNSWHLKSYVLETVHLSVSHTAENIASELIRIANEWSISEKVVALATDNASNAVAAARLTGWKHIPCFAHTLNLIVKGALEAYLKLTTLKKKCKDIVTFFHHSSKASEKLTDIQKQLEVPEKKLIQDVDTRWNSTYYMFERMIELHESVTTTLCLSGKTEMCISVEELEIIKKAVEVLKPFESATVEMSGSKFVTVSKVIPIPRSLQLVTVKKSTQIPLKQELIGQMQRRFLNMEGNLILAKSTLLDPRLKKLAFRNNEEARGLQSLNQELTGLLSVQESMTNQEEMTEMSSSSSQTSNVLWKEFDLKVSNAINAGKNNASVESTKYFNDKLIKREDDPINWWLMNGKYYPIMSMAQLHQCHLSNSFPKLENWFRISEAVYNQKM